MSPKIKITYSSVRCIINLTQKIKSNQTPLASSYRSDSLLLSRMVCRVEDLDDLSIDRDGIVADDVSVEK